MRAAMMGGFVAGALRIIYTFVTSATDGHNPLWVLQSIAGGVLGSNTFNGGLVSAALGIVFHFGIAIFAAGIYIAASRRVDLLNRFVIPSGILYGAAVYTFMSFVVMPLTDFPRQDITDADVAGGLVAHMLLVGIPIALAARWRGRY